MATRRSRTWSAISPLASSVTPVNARSTSGIWYRAARVRARPSLEATFCSTRAAANEPMPAALRTPASLSAGTRPVAAIRSSTSSASALIGGGGPPIPLPPGGVAAPGSVPGVRSLGGRSVSIYPSFEVSAGAAPALIPHRLNLTPPGADIALDEGLSALVGRPSLGTGSRPRGRPRLPRSRDGSGRPHLLRPQRRAPAFRGLGEHVLR